MAASAAWKKQVRFLTGAPFEIELPDGADTTVAELKQVIHETSGMAIDGMLVTNPHGAPRNGGRMEDDDATLGYYGTDVGPIFNVITRFSHFTADSQDTAFVRLQSFSLDEKDAADGWGGGDSTLPLVIRDPSLGTWTAQHFLEYFQNRKVCRELDSMGRGWEVFVLDPTVDSEAEVPLTCTLDELRSEEKASAQEENDADGPGTYRRPFGSPIILRPRRKTESIKSARKRV